jgi:hypothetical protein
MDATIWRGGDRMGKSLTVRRLFHAIFILLLFATIVFADGKQMILQVDRSLTQAVASGNKKAVDGLLDADFTWTDPDGIISSREQVLQDLTSFAKNSEGDSERKAFSYGQVGSVFGVQHNTRFERVWVKRPAGWRILVYQQVPERAPSVPAYGADVPVSAGCDNPCKTIPFRPTTEADRGVIESFEGMNTAIFQADADGWAKHVGDEDFGITSGALVTKANRIAALKKQKELNTPGVPAPLLSARFFDFGDTVVMTALHQPRNGKPHHFTRIWVKRDGVWQLVAGAQTEIQSAPPAITH